VWYLGLIALVMQPGREIPHQTILLRIHIYYTSECKSLWGEPEQVHRISAVTSVQLRDWVVAAELNDGQPLILSWKEK